MIAVDGLWRWFPTRNGRKTVLREVSFSVPSGRSVGLLGRNGAGKSTLLRLLGGLDQPDRGSVRVAGSVSWPLGLAGGWQGSMSGRENVQFVARIHGLDAADVRRVVDFAADFSELGADIDLPVRTYSSGMRGRLAFAASMAFEFDYYLIDELTAVGDAAFRARCDQALRARRSRSAVIMVSHNVNHLARQTDCLVLVEDGQASLYDDPQAGLAAYQRVIAAPRPRQPA